MRIDFVTVTHRPHFVEPLRESIRLFVGDLCDWGLAVVDGTKHDLFTGYNAAARQTTGEILAFIHDDVRLLGNPLTLVKPLEMLNEPRTGFIGIAGTEYLSKSGCWWGEDGEVDVIAGCKGMCGHARPNAAFGMSMHLWPPGASVFGQVVVLDGVLLLCHRRTFNALGGFDAAGYSGFHFYDLDITLRAALAGLVNLAAPIPLLHLSDGVVGDAWNRNRATFVEKFKNDLPLRLR